MDRCQLPPHRGGLLAEHWDVIEAEATRSESLSGLPMYGDDFPEDR
jgi:hypothetical protein